MLRRSALRLAEQGTQGYSSAASYSTKLEPKTKVTRGISFSYNKDAEKIAAMKTTTAQAGIVRIRDTVQQHDPRPAVVDSLLLDMPTKYVIFLVACIVVSSHTHTQSVGA